MKIIDPSFKLSNPYKNKYINLSFSIAPIFVISIWWLYKFLFQNIFWWKYFLKKFNIHWEKNFVLLNSFFLFRNKLNFFFYKRFFWKRHTWFRDHSSSFHLHCLLKKFFQKLWTEKKIKWGTIFISSAIFFIFYFSEKFLCQFSSVLIFFSWNN